MTTRQATFIAAKIAFAAAVITWLFRKVDAARVWDNFLHARVPEVLGGLFLVWLTVVIAGLRWHLLLRIFSIAIPVRPLYFVTQIGQFFAMFLPGPAGDDLTRMVYIARLAKGRTAEACTTVVIDRLIGLATVLFLAVICIPWHWSYLVTSPQTYWIAVGMLSAGAGACLFGVGFFAVGHPTHAWFQRKLGRLPAHSLRDELTRVWGLLATNKGLLARVILAASVTQFILCVEFYLAGRSVGIDIPLFQWFGFVPVVLAANAIPITIAGLGFRDYLLVLFLGVLGSVDDERALAASFVVLAINIGLALIGAVTYLLYRPSREAA